MLASAPSGWNLQLKCQLPALVHCWAWSLYLVLWPGQRPFSIWALEESIPRSRSKGTKLSWGKEVVSRETVFLPWSFNLIRNYTLLLWVLHTCSLSFLSLSLLPPPIPPDSSKSKTWVQEPASPFTNNLWDWRHCLVPSLHTHLFVILQETDLL